MNKQMSWTRTIILASGVLLLISAVSHAMEHCPMMGGCHNAAAATINKEISVQAGQVVLTGEKKKQELSKDVYFTYQFVTRPTMGSSILKVNVFDKNNKKRTDLVVKGIVDMPDMRGSHSSGVESFKLNKNGDYLLPVSFVMPGKWEVVIRIFDKKTLLKEGVVNVEI